MKKICFIISLVQAFVLLSGLVNTVLADSPTVVKLKLQKAYFAEKSEGDLDKAIELYSDIVEQSEIDKHYVAQAAYQLGCCFEKKGEAAKAVQYFQKVVSEYPDMEKWHGKAKLKLDELAPKLSGPIESVFENGTPPQEVMPYLMGEGFNAYLDSMAQGIQTNVIVWMVDNDYKAQVGGFTATDNSDEEGTGKYILSHFEPKRPKMAVYDKEGNKVATEWVDSANGGADLYWNAGRKLADGEKHYFFYTYGEKYDMAVNGDTASLYMQNYFGAEVNELFFLVVPNTLRATEMSRDYTDKRSIGGFDIYQWKKRNPKNTNNIVELKIKPGTGLGLLEEPWVDGDECTMSIKAANTDVEIGTLTYSFDKVDYNGKKCWKIEGDQKIAVAGADQKTIVVADCESYLPVTGYTKNALGEFSAEYNDENVILKVAGKDEKNIPSNGLVFDNEQVLMMMRMLPLSEGYSCKFKIFPVISGLVTECEISVLGLETIDSSSGEYECYKVSLKCNFNGSSILNHTAWVEKGVKRNLVKYDAGTAVMMLADNSKFQRVKLSNSKTSKVIETLQVDDGAKVDRKSIGGACEVVKFDTGGDKVTLKQVKFYGSRYGMAAAPNADFYIYVCNEKFEKVQTTTCSYKMFRVRGDASWWTCDIEPIEVSGVFYICINFEAEQRKGVFVYYDRDNSGSSFVGMPGGELKESEKGDWMIRAVVEKTNGSSVSKQDQLKSENLSSEGWKLWRERKLVEAEKTFIEAVELNPENENGWQGLGWAQLNQGKRDNASESFEKCVELNPKNSAALNGLGWIANGKGDDDTAIEWWEKAVKAQPGATASLSGLVEVYMKRKDNKNAEKYLKMWQKVDPGNEDVAQRLKELKGAEDIVCVVKTNPVALSDNVPVTLDKLEVEFNTRMKDGSWSWVGGGETFPKGAGKIHYDTSKRKCILPVELEPGKVYWVGINSPSHKNFRSDSGKPAGRYVILFATVDGKGNPTEIPADMLERAKAINAKSSSGDSSSNGGGSIPANAGEMAEKVLTNAGIIDEETIAAFENFERGFAGYFLTDRSYLAASDEQKDQMVKGWIREATDGSDFKAQTRAIAKLGVVKNPKGFDVLLELAKTDFRNNRPRWIAIRGLWQLGDRRAIPALIELVDHGNGNVRTYARVALAEMTGEYFGDDKAKWQTVVKQ